MTTNEPECVLLKRKGASHVSRLLAGKSLQEELLFWQERTENLKKGLTKSVQRTANRRR